MSRWLKNVNALLENLDNQVEETVEEHRFNRTLLGTAAGGDGADEDFEGGEEAQGVDDILAKRGLLDEEEDELVVHQVGSADDESAVGGGDEGIGGENAEPSNAADIQESAGTEQKDSVLVDKDADNENDEGGDDPDSEEIINFGGDSGVGDGEEENEQMKDLFAEGNAASADNKDTEMEEAENKDASSTESGTDSVNKVWVKVDKQKASAPAANAKPKAPSSTNLKLPPSSSNAPSAPAPKSNNAPNNTNTASLKELRKLRRHVLQLNSDLESAEREIEAQRAELDRAASRMERDRSRHKQEKESTEANHKAEVAGLVSAQERAMQVLKESNESALGEMEERVRRAEQQRAKEGGERDIDLANALERERASLASTAKLQDEKTTMNERITLLTTDVSRLETRLEHATSQMELSSERERNAEEQLDKALSLHARQLGVRQKRESELEQTVANLGGALVVAKTKVEAAMKAGINLDGNDYYMRSNSTGSTPREAEEDPLDLKARLQDSADEIETLKAQLNLERQRCSTLHNELLELAKEQADELSGAHAKQRQYERKISDLTTSVAKLQSAMRRSTVGGGDARLDSLDDIDLDASGSEEYTGLQHSGDEKKETDHLRKQITSMSEKIFEMQTRIDSGRAEVSTLKNRLRSAALRAETAEKNLEAANQRLIMMDAPGMSGMSSADEEMGMSSRKAARKRRQGGGALATRRGFQKSTRVESIRSALGLHSGRFPTGGWREMIASLLDTFDVLAIDLGSHFRHYPMSRLAFMMYLAMLHAWAFFLLVYHAHAQGMGVEGDSHGPGALLMSYRHMEQVPKLLGTAAVVNSNATP